MTEEFAAAKLASPIPTEWFDERPIELPSTFENVYDCNPPSRTVEAAEAAIQKAAENT